MLLVTRLLDRFLLDLRRFDVIDHLGTLSLQVIILLFQQHDLLLHLSFPLLRNQRLLHPIRYRAIIQPSQRLFNHAEFISHSHEEIASFSTIDCDLTDNFIEALCVDFLPDRADT